MATYVVGDIHGCFREWIGLKSKIERTDENAEFILVGDILDKGPHSLEMLKWAMEKIVPGSKYQMVLGNHETEKINWLKYVLKHQDKEAWNNRDIARNMLSADGYEFYKVCCAKNFTGDDWNSILMWLESLPFSIHKEIENEYRKVPYIILHNPQDSNGITETLIIHGHIPTTLDKCKNEGAIPGKIWIQGNRINIDCGLVYGVSKKQGLYGDLAAICLEDLQEIYYYNHYLKHPKILPKMKKM